MSKQLKARIRLFYGIFLTVLLLAVGACFIVSCIDIYHSGDRPFSREAVATHFHAFAWLVYITLAVLLLGIAVVILCPRERETVRGEVSPALTLARLTRRLDTDACGEALLDALSRAARFRLIVRVTAGILCAACAIPVAVYVCNPKHFSGDNINGDVFVAMLWMTVFFLVAVAIAWAAHVLNTRSLKREIESVKSAIASGACRKTVQAEAPAEPCQEEKGRKTLPLWLIRAVVLTAALVFIVLGIFNRGIHDVLQKAIRICTECIGLG